MSSFKRRGRHLITSYNITFKKLLSTIIPLNMSKYTPDNVGASAVTEIEVETFDFLWTLNNYSALSVNEVLKSPTFRSGAKSNHSWLLNINPKKVVENLQYLAVYLTLTEFGDGDKSADRKINVRFQISLLNADGIPEKQAGNHTMDHLEFQKGSKWGFNTFVLSTELISSTRRLVQNNSLKIHCRVWIFGDVKQEMYSGATKRKSLSDVENRKRRKEQLAIDFGKIFKDCVLTDITVIVGNNIYMAHKAVLVARSSVFAAMFNTNMVESKMNIVEIIDFDDEIVKAMLEYIYTGETELLSERAPDLIEIAEKYDIVGLKEDCENKIADNLNLENAANVFVMSHTYNAELLKHRVIDYINSNKECIKKSKTFQEVARAHSNLFVDLYLSQ